MLLPETLFGAACCLDSPTGRLDGLMIGLQLGQWSRGLISAVDGEISTTARKQMGAITGISRSPSVCSVWVNVCVAGDRGGGRESGKDIRQTNSTATETPYRWRMKMQVCLKVSEQREGTLKQLSSWDETHKSARVKSMCGNKCVGSFSRVHAMIWESFKHIPPCLLQEELNLCETAWSVQTCCDCYQTTRGKPPSQPATSYRHILLW